MGSRSQEHQWGTPVAVGPGQFQHPKSRIFKNSVVGSETLGKTFHYQETSEKRRVELEFRELQRERFRIEEEKYCIGDQKCESVNHHGLDENFLGYTFGMHFGCGGRNGHKEWTQRHPQRPALCKKTEPALLWKRWQQLPRRQDFRIHRRQQGSSEENVWRTSRAPVCDNLNRQGGADLPSIELCRLPAT